MLSTVVRVLCWATAGLASFATLVATASYRESSANAAPTMPEAAKDDNPRVAPGLVKWHASFADAQTAAQRSGKPVLLFHMMGQLDRQFC